MKRGYKNALMAAGIAVLLICGYFTMVQAGQDYVLVDVSEKLAEFAEETEEAASADAPKTFMKEQLKLGYIAVLTGISFSVALLISYLAVSRGNQKTFSEAFAAKRSILIFVAMVIVITAAGSFGQTAAAEEFFIVEEEEEKTTSADDVETGISVDGRQIDLSQYDSNITISSGGQYVLTGGFQNTVRIDSQDPVTLELDNVNIESKITSAIANIGTGKLVIHLPEGSVSTVRDNGYSDYDGCIYSDAPMEITGTGTLNVYGMQKEGEGIATKNSDMTIDGGNINVEANDDGLNTGGDGGTIAINGGNITIKGGGDGIDSNGDVAINGGNVFATGSSDGGNAGVDADKGYQINGGEVLIFGTDDMENPKKASEQTSIRFDLAEEAGAGEQVILYNGKEDILSFETKETFETVIVSSGKLTENDLETGRWSLQDETGRCWEAVCEILQ